VKGSTKMLRHSDSENKMFTAQFTLAYGSALYWGGTRSRQPSQVLRVFAQSHSELPEDFV
jgi:hypothetical protein